MISLKTIGAVCVVASVVSVPSVPAFRHAGAGAADVPATERPIPLAAMSDTAFRQTSWTDAASDPSCLGSSGRTQVNGIVGTCADGRTVPELQDATSPHATTVRDRTDQIRR